MTATARTCKYAAGDAVEVLRHNFEKPGFPREWVPGYVERVALINADKSIWNVAVRVGIRAFPNLYVGPRGGNNQLRPSAGDGIPADAVGNHGNQCAAMAYQAHHFAKPSADPRAVASDALYWLAIADRVDPDQADRWAALRITYAAPLDPASPEAAPAREAEGGLVTYRTDAR